MRRAGYGRPAFGPVPPESPLARPHTRSVDRHLADSLLDAAGWVRATTGGPRARVAANKSRPLSFELLTVGSSDNAIEQLIQSDLAAVGIRMEIRQLEGGAFLARAREHTKTFDAIITGVPGDIALSFLPAMFDSAQAGGALDYAAYHTAALDRLFATARAASTDASRRDAWGAIQDSLASFLPVSWIYHSRGVQGVSARLGNVRMDLRGELATLQQWSVLGPPGTKRR